MSTVKTKNVQIGADGTASNNFTIYQPSTPDGTSRWAVGVSGATTADVVTVNSSGNVGIGTTSPNNRLIVNGAVGVSGEAAAAISNGCLIDQTAGFLTRILNYSSTIGSAIALYTGSTGTSTERMRIDSSGRLIVQNGPVGAGQTSSTKGVQTYFDATNNIGYIYSTQSGVANYRLSLNGNDIDFNQGQMRIDSSGKLVMASTTDGLIGSIQAGITANTASTNAIIISAATANGPYPIGARGESTNQGLVGFFNSSNTVIGSITKSGNNVAYNTSSDYRLKENIAPMTGALDKIAQLNPVTYTWKSDGLAGQGFIAHELQEVVPECVNGQKDAVNEDGSIKPQGVDTSFLVATLTAAIQELTKRVQELEAKVN